MGSLDAILPGLLALMALILAHLFSRKAANTSDVSPQADYSEFSASIAVRPETTTVFEYTPPVRWRGHHYTPSVGRTFDNLQLERYVPSRFSIICVQIVSCIVDTQWLVPEARIDR